MALAIALSASADIHSLPTPPPSEFVDAESSLTVPLPATEGRHIRLTLAFDSSPTNAVQVAFGIDANHDNDLAPEETTLRVGIDCGQPLWNLSTDRRSLCVAKSLEWWHLARSGWPAERARCPFHVGSSVERARCPFHTGSPQSTPTFSSVSSGARSPSPFVSRPRETTTAFVGDDSKASVSLMWRPSFVGIGTLTLASVSMKSLGGGWMTCTAAETANAPANMPVEATSRPLYLVLFMF